MPLLKRLLLCLCLISSISLSAQLACGTIMGDDPYFENLFLQENQNVSMESFATSPPLVIKIKFWDVAFDNGDNPEALNVEQTLGVVANLNKTYNTFNIFFKYDGKGQVNATDFRIINAEIDSPEPSEFMNFVDDNNLYDTGTINIYSIKTLENAGGYFQDQNDGKFGMIVTRSTRFTSNLDDSILFNHEVGHFFNLKHTFHTDQNCDDCPLYIENVTRDPNDLDCYNANTRGDRVIDTFATPVDMELLSNCEYVSNGEVDDCGIAYDANGLEPETDNYMSYGDCQETFTPGQIVRMRFYIEIWDSLPEITLIDNHDVSILYEPYAGFYAPYFPYAGNEPSLFQPGFTYRFVECACECPQPTDFEDINFSYTNTSLLTISADETDYSLIAHPNHSAITIAEVPEIFGNPQEERRCWDNWVTPPVIGGTVTLFNDGVFNTNVTIMPQDSTQINNPNLINDLDNGLYNIKKQIIDGTVDEINILKENE